MDMNISGGVTQVLPIDDDSQVGHARRTAQKLAEGLGLDESDAGRVALVATELASNLLKHAGRGELHLRTLPRSNGAGVEIVAVDRASGFELEACLTDGYSTGGTQGIGLGAISRQADVFDAYADARGAVLLARLYPRTATKPDLPIGVSQHSLNGDPACGDACCVVLSDNAVSALVIDGLGHGEEAEQAALAGTQAFANGPFNDPLLLIDDLHRAMRGTRGGAVAIAQARLDGGQLRFVGIGNITANLIGAGKSRGMASHPGIVGGQFRKAQPFDFEQVTGQLLVMHSDGLQSRWNLDDYPGLAYRHPAVIAAVLHRDFCRGRDDVTVVVIALEAIHG